jgi:hypothetical protein
MINNYTILQPSSNFASAPETDILVPINLESSQREINESDRNTYVDLQGLYSNERQSCTIFRPTFKFSFLYDNKCDGSVIKSSKNILYDLIILILVNIILLYFFVFLYLLY